MISARDQHGPRGNGRSLSPFPSGFLKQVFSLASLSFAMEKPKLPSIKLMLEGLSGREEQEGNVRWI